MDLTIQIVNFRSRHYLEECLFSISENLPEEMEVEVLIINNDEEILDRISDSPENKFELRVIEFNKNIGFGKAQNLGFKQSRGKYILFLNPDTKILSGALREMLRAFASDEKIGVVGPLLVDSANKFQADCFGVSQTPLSTIGRKIFVNDRHSTSVCRQVFETDWVSGGAMMARRNVFKEVGGFDEKYFMYFEDVDLCQRVKNRGYKIVVNPAARIFHESGKSFASTREKKKYYYASQDYYLRKHFGPVWAMVVKLLRFPYYVKNVWLK